MTFRNILLTSDDGYVNGNFLPLAKVLQDQGAKVTIVVTEMNSSGAGAAHFTRDNYTWREETIESFRVVIVDGFPVDAMEFARSYFKDTFDLCISGINPSYNLGLSIYQSGTVAAAIRAVGNRLSKKGLAISSEIKTEESLALVLKKVPFLLRYLQETKFLDVEVINVNVPPLERTDFLVTSLHIDLTQIYYYPLEINKKNMTFNYPNQFATETNPEKGSDLECVQNGRISITKLL